MQSSAPSLLILPATSSSFAQNCSNDLSFKLLNQNQNNLLSQETTFPNNAQTISSLIILSSTAPTLTSPNSLISNNSVINGKNTQKKKPPLLKPKIKEIRPNGPLELVAQNQTPVRIVPKLPVNATEKINLDVGKSDLGADKKVKKIGKKRNLTDVSQNRQCDNDQKKTVKRNSNNKRAKKEDPSKTQEESSTKESSRLKNNNARTLFKNFTPKTEYAQSLFG